MSLVNVEVHDRIGVVTLDRPEAMNAISGAMADAVTAALHRVGSDPDIWCGVLAAAGDKAFCVGADLKERASFELEDFHANRRQVRGMFQALRDTPQPMVAATFGFTLGGGFELALSCDLMVAAQGTTLGLPEATVGLLPAGGGTQLLTRKLGTSRAKELIFTGRRMDAKEAAELGLVARAAGEGQALEVAMELARDICRSSPVAVREAKRCIDQALGVPLAEGIEIEHDSWTRVIATQDRSEGIEAFNGKRAAEWQNR